MAPGQLDERHGRPDPLRRGQPRPLLERGRRRRRAARGTSSRSRRGRRRVRHVRGRGGQDGADGAVRVPARHRRRAAADVRGRLRVRRRRQLQQPAHDDRARARRTRSTGTSTSSGRAGSPATGRRRARRRRARRARGDDRCKPLPGHYRVRVVNWAAGAPADGLDVSFSNVYVGPPPERVVADGGANATRGGEAEGVRASAAATSS